MISFEHFSFRYRDGVRPALDEVSFCMEEGEIVLLTGPSGCGKSTLALAAAGFLFTQYDGETSGRVLLEGASIQELPIYDVSDVVGLVQQNPESQFCTLTVEDEIVFGLENRKYPREKIQQELDWSLQAVGAQHLRSRRLSSLSGGEKQKIALAAILAARPRVIIFDEPTSNLDPSATREIFETILRLREEAGLTVLVIEHKLDFLSRIQPRMVFMKKGRIVRAEENRFSRGWEKLTPPVYSGRADVPLVEVENLSAGFDKVDVLQQISFEIHPGELISLMGDNGSGKSTLLLSLLGLVKGSGGRVRVFGQDLSEGYPAGLGQKIGLVFQNPDHQLFADSVWEEAAFAPRNFQLPETGYEERIRQLLHQAGLAGREKDHPYRLSYGEKRRLNMISVLAYQPSLLLLDEIFIGQDRENAHFLLTMLIDFVEGGGSVVMVNHNPEYYPRAATRLMFLAGGELLVDAPIEKGMTALQQLGKTPYLPGGKP